MHIWWVRSPEGGLEVKFTHSLPGPTNTHSPSAGFLPTTSGQWQGREKRGERKSRESKNLRVKKLQTDISADFDSSKPKSIFINNVWLIIKIYTSVTFFWSVPCVFFFFDLKIKQRNKQKKQYWVGRYLMQGPASEKHCFTPSVKYRILERSFIFKYHIYSLKFVWGCSVSHPFQLSSLTFI